MGISEKPKTAIVIGSGVGGVATAARLAKAGFKVTVLEKNNYVGGRCSLIHREGYRFDQGPSLLLLPRLFFECYKDLDTSLEAEDIKLVKCEPNYHVWFGDGEQFELSTDISRMKSEVERWEGQDGFERYLQFLQESHRHYELSIIHVLKKNFMSLFALVRPSFLKHLLDMHPFDSVYSRASRYFWSERLRRVFTFASMYMGMSPYDAPGTYSLLQYTELAEGIWYPIGGFNKIIQGIVGVGKRMGVDYRLDTSVSSIKLSDDHKEAKGVVLSNGETLAADTVVCNADLVYAYNNLLPSTSYAKSLSTRSASCSSISFYWAIDRKVPQLNAHNIFLADEYKESFDSIFKKHLIPTEPSFYVNVPSRVDPSAAPDGKDSIVVLVPVGHLLDDNQSTSKSGDSEAQPSSLAAHSQQDWDSMVALARRTVIKTVAARTGVDLAPIILHESVNTPVSWREEFNLDRGAILGLSHSFFNVLSFRPRTKHSDTKGLYFVGASTHPGTGVPICLAGSKIVSEQILDDYGMEIPWDRKDLKSKNMKGVDRVQRPLFVMDFTASLWVLALMTVAFYIYSVGGFGL